MAGRGPHACVYTRPRLRPGWRQLVHAVLCTRAAVQVGANSAGEGPACFDGTETLCQLPCPDNDARDRPWAAPNAQGVLTPCCPAGMDRVAPPTRSANYQVSAAATSYRPCELLTITVDVIDPAAKYLGLLLYAVRAGGAAGAAEQKLGQWVVAPDQKNMFWAPPGCGGAALMHSNAGVKHFHHEFSFRAPADGTGPIVFRALLKHGETNGGAFYWPAADLTLAEAGAGAAVAQWVQGAPGGSCQATCAKQGLTCDGESIAAAAQQGTPDLQYAEGPGRRFPCREPLLSNNGRPCGLPGLLTAHGFCWGRDDGQCGPTTATACAASSPGRARFCACAPRLASACADKLVATAAPTLTPTPQGTAAPGGTIEDTGADKGADKVAGVGGGAADAEGEGGGSTMVTLGLLVLLLLGAVGYVVVQKKRRAEVQFSKAATEDAFDDDDLDPPMSDGALLSEMEPLAPPPLPLPPPLPVGPFADV